MPSAGVERKLKRIATRLRELRDEMAVVAEQLDDLSEHAEEARLRALVSETPLADVEHRDAQRHAEAMTRHRDAVGVEIARLEAEQDALLDAALRERR